MCSHLTQPVQNNFVVDCEWADWEIGECSVSCGGGSRINTRSKDVVENNSGVCLGESSEEEECNSSGCPGAIHLFFNKC